MTSHLHNLQSVKPRTRSLYQAATSSGDYGLQSAEVWRHSERCATTAGIIKLKSHNFHEPFL